MKLLKILLVIALFTTTTAFSQKRAMTIDDLWKMGRLSQVTLSPDEKNVAFTLTYYDMETNKSNADIWLLSLITNTLTQLTNSPKGENSPTWFPNSKDIAYVSSVDGTPQIYKMNIDDKTNSKKLTNLYFGASGPVISPDGTKLLFTSEVYPDCMDDDCNKFKENAKEQNKVKAKIITELMYRHWDSWRDEKRTHLFILDINTLEYKDILQGSQADCPPIALGGKSDYTFSPDGKEICFVYNADKVVATSTNNDLFTISVDLKNKKQITATKGNDNQPIYSNGGKFILFRQMRRAGFEADKYNLILYNRISGTFETLTEKLDRSADEVMFSSDDKFIYFSVDNLGRKAIYKLNIATKAYEMIYDKSWNTDLNLSKDADFIIMSQSSVSCPAEIFILDLNSKETVQLTQINQSLMDQLEMMPLEDFWCMGANGTKIHTLMIKPPKFDPSKKYPMIFLVHGGPQGAWEDLWHYRWNPQLYASPGYVVLMPNPRGSTGYGQKFTDEISGDWGGKAYQDLMNAYDYAVNNFSFIDKNRTGASGASYGGYMMNWIATKTNRFRAIVTHAGVYNLESMYGTTEELWFPEWEYKGTPWTNRDMYRKFSPHQFVQNIKTPMLVTHGANDFRVPESQAMELFTSLQRLGVPSKFILFPDETHFVAKPQNFKLWMTEIFKWFDYWFKK